jgi:hypothetical protein
VRWALARRQGVPFRVTPPPSHTSTTLAAVAAALGAAEPDAASGGGISGSVLALPGSLVAPSPATVSVAGPVPAVITSGGLPVGPSPSLEPQLLDYTTHQAKLMPLLASAVAFTFTAHRMAEMYESLMSGLDSDDATLLPDVHATSAGLKAFCTWATHYGIDACRQACGGHGYSAYSRLPQMFEGEAQEGGVRGFGGSGWGASFHRARGRACRFCGAVHVGGRQYRHGAAGGSRLCWVRRPVGNGRVGAGGGGGG